MGFQGIGADPEQLRHRFAHATVGVPEMFRCAKKLGIYAARISFDRRQMQVERTSSIFSPGMAVTAEIKTGSRAVISYLLSPLLKYKQESLRER